MKRKGKPKTKTKTDDGQLKDSQVCLSAGPGGGHEVRLAQAAHGGATSCAQGADGLESVKLSYTKLINCDKVQVFHLGALIYSLIGLLCLAGNLVHRPPASPTAPPCRAATLRTSWQLVALMLPLSLLLAAIFLLRLFTFESSAAAAGQHQEHEQSGAQSAGRPTSAPHKWLEWPRRRAGLVLSVALLTLPIGFAHWDARWRPACASSQQVGPGLWAPLALASCLVYILPVVLADIACAEWWGRSWATAQPVRLSPILLPAVVVAALVVVLLVPPPLAADARERQLLLTVALAAVGAAFVCGQLRRHRLAWLAGEAIFAGANELIEAKVRLERERQQQETLLLSVLPAYVAEQVKRNMRKKMENQDEQQAASSPVSAAHQDFYHNHHYHHHYHAFVSTTNATTQTTGPGQVRSLTLATGDSRPAPAQPVELLVKLAAASRQRRSFARLSRISTSLASGAAYIGGALLNRSSSVSGSGSDRQAQVSSATQMEVVVSGPAGSTARLAAAAVATSGQPAPIALVAANSTKSLAVGPPAAGVGGGSGGVPSPGGSLQQQQSRRGFNELYIRTYNNVSLLYGDIVGFTSLCTQLSSSQLVRVLNSLFSHFDHLADQHKIMRIKILGDCYYGVSGIPEFAVMGAKSCAGARPRKRNTARAVTSQLENHAINCVDMGLAMINHIKCLNIGREHSGAAPTAATVAADQLPAQFELNMRIGIHTGHIHSGVIGLKKWQFDVWSNDVSIAMHCESSGVAGRVQVTEATVAHLRDTFTLEPAPVSSRDSFLDDKHIRTYLIKERLQPAAGAAKQQAQPQQQQAADSLDRRRARQPADKPATMDEAKIRAATIGTIRQTLLPGEMPSGRSLSGLGLALGHTDMRWLSLRFRDPTQEQQYLAHPFALAAVLRELALLAGLFATILLLDHQLLLVERRSSPSHLATMFASLALLWLLLAGRLAARSSATASPRLVPEARQTATPAPTPDSHHQGRGRKWSLGELLDRLACDPSTLARWRRTLERRTSCRRATGESACQCLVLLVFAIVILGQFYLIRGQSCAGHEPSSATGAGAAGQTIGLYQLTVILVLLALDSSVLLLNYKLKSSFILLIGALQLLLLTLEPRQLERVLCWPALAGEPAGARGPRALPAAGWPSDALLLVMALWSLAHARQLEHSNRCNFLWRNRLNVDHEELEYISGINKVLLENILPSHVVQHYLSASASYAPASSPHERHMSGGQLHRYLSHERQLYHEQHDSVAVMFASIPHFYEFYDESDISKQGLGCIALLNEIICDFDKLLLKNKFSRIEKIKTIGSTYMAAAGLRPNSSWWPHAKLAARTSSASHLSGAEPAPSSGQARLASSQQKMNLLCMVQFATSLMSALNGINKQSFQVFKLRVGVNTGPVIAGIIGAHRPFYDIWGDCVNIASRMESLGQIGRIQVEERTARLLMECLCTESYSIQKRGHINVKGKGGMLTYFVDKKEAHEPQQQQQHDQLQQVQSECPQQQGRVLSASPSQESLGGQIGPASRPSDARGAAD